MSKTICGLDMSEKNTLSKIEETFDIINLEEENTLLNDVASEMHEKYKLVNEIIDMLYRDTRQTDVTDEDGFVIGQRTHLHPQLLSWMKEARLFQDDLWKLTGGEIKQEGQKQTIQLMTKIVLEGISQNPEFLQKKFKEWTENRSFKNEKNRTKTIAPATKSNH